jgi:hypothetical protein
MQKGFIKFIGHRPVYPVGMGWNETSEPHQLETSTDEREGRKDETPRSSKIQRGVSNNRIRVPVTSK